MEGEIKQVRKGGKDLRTGKGLAEGENGKGKRLGRGNRFRDRGQGLGKGGRERS